MTRVRKIDVGSQIGAGLSGYCASIGQCLVCADLGLPGELHDNHASYIEHWLRILMEEAQRRTLFYTYPAQLHKIFLLSEMSGDYRDIKDPYRRPREEYERCADELTQLIEDGYPTILKRLKIDITRIT